MTRDQEEDRDHLIQKFVISNDQQAQFAHRALTIILATFNKEHRSPNWRAILEDDRVPAGVTNLRGKAREALRTGFLQRVFDIEPAVLPDFLISVDEANL